MGERRRRTSRIQPTSITSVSPSSPSHTFSVSISISMGSSAPIHVFNGVVHPEREAMFLADAPSKSMIKDGRKEAILACTKCGKAGNDEQPVKKCAGVSQSFTISQMKADFSGVLVQINLLLFSTGALISFTSSSLGIFNRCFVKCQRNDWWVLFSYHFDNTCSDRHISKAEP